MKLKNLIAPLQQKFRKAISLTRLNPFSDQGQKMIANTLINRGRRKLENLEIPQRDSSSLPRQENLVGKSSDYIFEQIPNLYPLYQKCDRNDPLGCDRPLATLKKAPLAKFCSKCGFPAQLPENKEIRGRRGTYQVTHFLRRQGNGRIYTAIQQNSGQEIVIKEYLLPRRYFDDIARQHKKDIFERLVNFQVASAIPSDFRLIIPQEGIKDSNQDRCYLITPNNLGALPNLKTYLAQQGRMEQDQVIKLLDQVLQSLDFLHSQKWQFTSGAIQPGLVHGNLSLDSLLISQTEVGFLVYLWDLSAWEDLFNPQSEATLNKRVIDDLEALGNIGLYLLAARDVTRQNRYPINPRNDLNWRDISPPLKSFLLRLIGLNSRFNDAATARRELRQLMQHQTNLESIPGTSLETTDATAKTPIWLPWVIFSTIIILLGGILLKRCTKETITGDSLAITCCIEKIKNVPTSSDYLTYGTVASQKLDSIFDINFDQQNHSTYLEFAKNDSEIKIDPVNPESLIDIIQQKQKIRLLPQSFNTQQQLINNLEPGKINLALVNFAPNKNQKKIPINNKKEVVNHIIAYDGILVFVALKPCPQCEEIGKYLEQKITLEQLKNIYTGKVDYWHEINPNIPKNIKIKTFAPENEYALEIFKKLVFKDQEPDISDFNQSINSGKIKKLKSFSMLSEIRDVWKQGNIAGIGFAFQSIAYKQCNVYPLAVVKEAQDFFPILIKKADQQGVNFFEDLNCKYDKNLYQLNEPVFRSGRYPLAFSLNLLYLNDDREDNLEFGKKMAEIFKTKEFQCHLSHKTLIPLELSEKDCK